MEPSRMERIDQVYAKWQRKGPRRERFDTRGSCNTRPHAAQPPAARPARYRRRLQYKEQRADEANNSRFSNGFIPSLGVDLSEAQTAESQKVLSLSRCCSQCLPSSRTKFVSKEFSSAGLQDVLRLDSVSTTKSSWWRRLLPLPGYAYHLEFSYPIPDVRVAALSSERVQRAVEKSVQVLIEAQNNEKVSVTREALVKQERARAVGIVKNASGQIYKWLLRLSVYVLLRIMARLFHHMHVQRSHIEMLIAAQKQGVPMVFLPSHKSHLDYILISFILAQYNIKVPHIAAGENLNISLFTHLIRHLGGFFIRRKLHSSVGAADSVTLYWECLHEYFEQLLKNNQNLEIFLEGSRSRTGKPSQPKAGLLSFLVSAIKEGVVSDILIVPVSICYDRNFERNFIREELMGGTKTPESLLQALKGTWTMLTQNVGSVRVDFAQPFSLQEYLESAVISRHSLMGMTFSSSQGQQSFPSSPSFAAFSTTDSFTRRQITALSHHIVYNFTNCSSLMASAMVAFLLLTKHRQGVQLPGLITDYEWLSQKALSSGRALGFSGSSSEAVHYTIALLSNLLLHDQATNIVSTPLQELPSALELFHHANQVSTMFIQEAIIACGIEVLCDDDQAEDEEEEDDWAAQVGTNKEVLVSQDELTDAALLLCRIFSREFVFAPPCVDVTTELMDGIETLSAAEILKKQQSHYLPYSSHGGVSRCSKMSWDDGDEEEEDELATIVTLKVSTSPEAVKYLAFLRSVLGPYIEGYWSVAMELAKMEGELPNESTLLRQLHETQMNKVDKGLLVYVESCSMDILRNALKSYLTMEVLVDGEGDTLVINCQSQLLKIIDTLTKCKP